MSDDRTTLTPTEYYAIVDQAFALILSLHGRCDQVSSETAYSTGKAMAALNILRSRVLTDMTRIKS